MCENLNSAEVTKSRKLDHDTKIYVWKYQVFFGKCFLEKSEATKNPLW